MKVKGIAIIINGDNNNNNTSTKQINIKKDNQKSQSNVDYDLDLIMIEELKGTGRVGMSEMYRTAKRAGTLMQFAFVVFLLLLYHSYIGP